MTIVPLFLLTLGAINWGYAYPLVFLFVALLRQRMLGREIYFNFLYAPGFWLLLSAGMTYALIGMRTISGVYHHGVLHSRSVGSLLREVLINKSEMAFWRWQPDLELMRP